jgi:hypothetical protein
MPVFRSGQRVIAGCRRGLYPPWGTQALEYLHCADYTLSCELIAAAIQAPDGISLLDRHLHLPEYGAAVDLFGHQVGRHAHPLFTVGHGLEYRKQPSV